MFRLPRSLQGKVLVAASLSALLAILATDIVFLSSQKRHFRAVARRLDQAILKSWRDACIEMPRKRDWASLHQLARTMAEGEGAPAYVFFLGPDDTFFAHSDIYFLRKPYSEWEKRRDMTGVREMRAVVPFGTGGAGQVGIGFRTIFEERMYEAQRKEVLPSLLYVNGIILLLIIAASFSVSWLLVTPIRELAEATRKVSMGEFGTQVRIRGEDELSALQGEFNLMAKRLGELDELKADFLSKITHDLRNPLAAIIGFLELFEMGTLGEITEKQKKSIKVMKSSGEYLRELIDNILDATKLEAKSMEFHKALLDLPRLIETVAGLMRVKAEEFGLTLDTRIQPDLPKVEADEQAIRRVILNFLSNALKFTPKGGTVTILAQRAPDDRVQVGVADSGIGIPKEKLSRLFLKFAKIHEESDLPRQVKGTGLGLVICKEIVEGHGGTVSIASDPGKGTVFYFTLRASV